MDAILALPASLPRHVNAELAAAPCRTVTEWPVGTFVENLAVLDDGSIAVSVLSEARVDRVSIAGERTTLHQFEAPTTGIVSTPRGLFVAVGEPGATVPTLWRIDPMSGAAEPWMKIEGSIFTNGVTVFSDGVLIAADSWHGALILIDLTRKKTSIWLQDELLERAPSIDMLPGANGVKRYRDEVTVSSNGRALLLRAGVNADGSAGPLRILAEHLRVDDLAYDREGDLYLTTHIGHSLDRFSRDGTRVSLGAADQGLAGSTACAFGRTPDTSSKLYVTTTGGIVLPLNGKLQPAKLVELEVGKEGFRFEELTSGSHS